MRAIVRRRLTRRFAGPDDVPSGFDDFEVIGAFNPGAIEFDGGIALLIRVAVRPRTVREGFVALPFWDWRRGEASVDWRSEAEVEFVDPRVVRLKDEGVARLTFLSFLLPAFSHDGFSLDSFGEPFLPANRYETFGVEDPRLTRIGERHYFTYVSVSEHGAATSLASTSDFRSFERHGVIFPPENKDVLLFPERFDGAYAAMHRPNPNTVFHPQEMWLSRSPDLIHWGRHERLLGSEAAWATGKVGGGTPPIRTERGWLSLFHGNLRSAVKGQVGAYAAAAMLQDADDPRRVIGLSPQPVMVPKGDFERAGFLKEIVFPTAMIARGDEALVYYGAADTSTGVAVFSLAELLGSIAVIG